MNTSLSYDRRQRRRPAKLLALAGTLALAGAGVFAASAPAYATGSIADVSFSVSNNATSDSATSVSNTAIYTWQFTTATANESLTSIVLTVPEGTSYPASGAAAPTIYGLGNCTVNSSSGIVLTAGSPATVTVPLTGSDCTSVDTGTQVSIAIPSFTNTTTPTSGFKTEVTTEGAGSAEIDDGTATSGVDFNQNSTAVTVYVPESLTFTNNNTAISLAPVPDSSTAATAKVGLGVKTNAAGGYTLNACVTTAGAIKSTASGSTATIQQAKTTPTALDPVTNPGFGATVVLSGGTTVGTLSPGTWSSTTPSGYDASCNDVTSGSNSTIAEDDGPASGDAITVNNQVVVPATQPGGVYTGTITYSVTPTY